MGEQHEVEDLKISDVINKDKIKNLPGKLGEKGKGLLKNVGDKISHEEKMMENDEYAESMGEAKEIANGSRGVIIAATIIGPFAGPMAVLFSIDMDETQFKIIAAVLIANALASAVTAFINDLNLRSTAKSVARSLYYKLSHKSSSDKKDNDQLQEKIERIEQENKDLRIEKKAYDELKFKVAVEDGVKNANKNKI